MILRSKLLARAGFRHGFSLRDGGVSVGPFESLNLGRAVGDDPAHVAENSRRFLRALEIDAVFESSQVHGRDVVSVDDRTIADVRAIEADALVTHTSAVGVRTADCIPILIGDTKRGVVAAVHAGWRGVVLRVLDAALDVLASDPGDLVAAIGPHIRAASFEVGPDVAAQIAAVAHGEDIVIDGDRPHVDLTRALVAQLRARGVVHIDDVGGCTFAEPDRFFSYRRDGQKSGRHLAAIASFEASC